MTLSESADERVWKFLNEPESGPQKFGKYVLKQEIGQGATSVVYEAEDPELGRRVALKVLRDVVEGSQGIARMQREAAIIARLDHPNIVKVYEVGHAADASGASATYIAMEFVAGKDFAALLREGGTPRDALVRIVEDTARAIGHAHSKEIIHRDIKPENVMVDGSGRVVVMDFGLARGDMFKTRLTNSGAIMGTPAYMPPEQASGKTHDLTPRSDVYALGAVLYEVLTGVPPHDAGSMEELLAKIVGSDPVAPRKLRGDIPSDLETIVLKCLDKDPARRYPTAAELADDLERCRTGEPIRAKPAGLFTKLRRKAARHLVPLTAAAAVLCVIGFSTLLLLRTERYQSDYNAGMEEWNGVLSKAGTIDRTALERRIDRALQRFESAAQRVPDKPEPWLMIGRCRALRGDSREAEKAWTTALEKQPDFAPARLERAQLYIGTYSRLRVRPAIRVGKGKVRFGATSRESESQAEWLAKAKADLEALRHSGQLDPGDRMRLEGLLAFGSGLYAEAARLLSSAHDAGGLALLGLSQLYAGEFGSAKESFSRSLNLDPDAALYRLRGDVHFCLAEYESAQADYEAARALRRDDPEVLCNFGLCCRELRQYDKADQILTQALEARPDFVRALNARASVRFDLNRLDDARKDYEKALDFSGADAEAFNGLGSVYLKQGKIDRAVKEFGTAIDIDPDYVEAYANRGLAHMRLARLKEAAEDYRKAAERDPSDPELHLQAGKLCLALNDPSNGRKHLETALRHAPADWAKRPDVEQMLREMK